MNTTHTPDRYEITDRGELIAITEPDGTTTEICGTDPGGGTYLDDVVIGAIRQQARDLDQLRADLAAAVAKRDEWASGAARLSSQLGNLLAVIHRDGGHYESEHGTEKACADAELAVHVQRGIADGYHDALKIWRQRAEQAEARLAALAELDRAAAEPVAWMWEDMLGISHTYVSPKRPTWPDAGAISEMAVAINVRPLYAAPVAEIREVVVTDEVCDRAYIGKWRGVPELIGHEPDDEDRQWSREWLEAWRAELGPALGLVEIREPSDDECRAIWREAKANEGDGSKVCAGRAMFDACRAVMWPKEAT